MATCIIHFVVLIKINNNIIDLIGTDVSTRCSGRPRGMKTSYETC